MPGQPGSSPTPATAPAPTSEPHRPPAARSAPPNRRRSGRQNALAADPARGGAGGRPRGHRRHQGLHRPLRPRAGARPRRCATGWRHPDRGRRRAHERPPAGDRDGGDHRPGARGRDGRAGLRPVRAAPRRVRRHDVAGVAPAPTASIRRVELDPEMSPGGESVIGFARRVIAALDRLLAEHGGRSFALVVHGGVISGRCCTCSASTRRRPPGPAVLVRPGEHVAHPVAARRRLRPLDPRPLQRRRPRGGTRRRAGHDPPVVARVGYGALHGGRPIDPQTAPPRSRRAAQHDGRTLGRPCSLASTRQPPASMASRVASRSCDRVDRQHRPRRPVVRDEHRRCRPRVHRGHVGAERLEAPRGASPPTAASHARSSLAVSSAPTYRYRSSIRPPTERFCVQFCTDSYRTARRKRGGRGQRRAA